MKRTMKLLSLILIFFFLACNGEENNDRQAERKPASAYIDTAKPTSITPPPPNLPQERVKTEATDTAIEEKPSATKREDPAAKETTFTPPPIVEEPQSMKTEEKASETPETPTSTGQKEEPKEGETGVSHQLWDQLLQQHVSASGQVDYSGLKGDKAKLERYLQTLSGNPPGGDWGRNEKMTYWINAYNAYTVKLIVDNYPLSSIRDLHSGNPWDVKWVELGDKTYSLNNIENDILRPRFGDARIHFAVNCAAQSCPPLHNRAFTAGKLNQQLEQVTKSFINNPKYNKLRPDRVVISKIFDWYAQDFGKVIAFLNKYTEIKIQESATIEYMEYSWDLNE